MDTNETKPIENTNGPQANLLSLNDDCLFEIFDFLSIFELHPITSTCKHLHRVLSEYLERRCANMKLQIYGKINPVCSIGTSEWLNNFICKYTQRLEIWNGSDEDFQLISRKFNKQLREIRFVRMEITETHTKYIQNHLNCIESLEFEKCVGYLRILKYCKTFKRLSIDECSQNEWMLQKYPELQHLRWNNQTVERSIELKMLFQQNPTITSFWTSAIAFVANEDLLPTMIDELGIIFDRNDQNISSTCQRLNGHYKQLQLVVHPVNLKTNAKDLIQLSKVYGLQMPMHCDVDIETISTICSFHKLRTLNIGFLESMASIVQLVQALPDLTKVSLSVDALESIFPFIQKSEKLKEICLNWIRGKTNIKCIDVQKLNRERKQMTDACKVIVYVREGMLLEMKWAGKDIVSELIEFKNIECLPLF